MPVMPEAVDGAGTMPPGAAEVRVDEVSKFFALTRALSDVSLTLRPGAIHALVGANGAGKSTLLGIIAGRIEPTGGTVHIGGERLAHGSPRDAARLGVAAIYQELTIVPAMSAIENVFLGAAADDRRVLTAPATARRRYRDLCDRVGARVAPGARAGSVSVADQQLLEIMRCVHREARVVLLDEPTSALALAERERLFAVMRDLRAEGRTLAFVSHDLEEVLEISDVITVFRNGQLVDTRPTPRWTKDTMIEAMLGEAYETYASRSARRSPRVRAESDARIEVSGLQIRAAAPEVGFSVQPGEVLGLAGLAGSGRSTLLRALAGDLRSQSGRITIDGRPRRIPRSAVEARNLGIALVPEDRKAAGLAMAMSAGDNVSMPMFRGTRDQFGLRRFARTAAEGASRVGFPEQSLPWPARTLSGGNQQKLLLARWAVADVKLLLVDEPTRGVDIAAKVSILETLQALADRGLAVIIVSSELEDLEEVCDRVLVMRHGRVVETLSRADGELSVDAMLALSFQ